MEKTSLGAVVPLAAGWNDVGSWSALHDVLPRDARGNATTGDALLESCDNCYVAATGRVVAAVGLDNVVIVETDDAVLVVHRDRVQDVKRIVETLKAEGRKRLLSGGE
jgi:mannose-1-phosphate guanylyltransferase